MIKHYTEKVDVYEHWTVCRFARKDQARVPAVSLSSAWRATLGAEAVYERRAWLDT